MFFKKLLRNIFFSDLSYKNPIIIDNHKAMELMASELESEDILAIDTEFDWRTTYHPKLSLIQIASKNSIYLIDCLKINLKQLKQKLFKDSKKLLIFHSVRSDTTVLSSALEVYVKNVYDIQIAEKQISKKDFQAYGEIVKKYCRIRIDKDETKSNWLRRPLTDSQINYAANDVRFLIRIYFLQKKILNKKINLYSDVLRESKIQAEKGNEKLYMARLRRKKLSLFEKKIFMWREKVAEEQNTPISYIFKDKKLKDLSHSLKSKNMKMLTKILGDNFLVERLIKEVK